MNRNFTKLKNLMWLLLIEMEKEVADVNGNEMCTDRTLEHLVWNFCTTLSTAFCLFVCFFFFCFLLVTLDKQ